MQISENDINLQAQLIADETIVWGCACHVDENCRQTISWQEPTPGILRRRTDDLREKLTDAKTRNDSAKEDPS